MRRKKGIIAKCPGSCGELMQGIVGKREQLISYPINCYSYVRLMEGYRNNEKDYPKAYKALDRIFDYFKEDKSRAQNLKIEIQSDIPQGKGMASSTADLGATLLAAARYLGKEISPEKMTKLALEVEPTDSTLFPYLTLLEYIEGTYYKSYQKQLHCKVLILEGHGVVDTVDFCNLDRKAILEENIPKIHRAMQKVEKGIVENDLKKIGQGAILSAFANERILKKPGLEKVTAWAEEYGAYGINVAHSGTVLGILFDDKFFDKEAFLHQIKKEDFYKNYTGIKEYQIVKGGPEIIEMEEYE